MAPKAKNKLKRIVRENGKVIDVDTGKELGVKLTLLEERVVSNDYKGELIIYKDRSKKQPDAYLIKKENVSQWGTKGFIEVELYKFTPHYASQKQARE